MAWGYACATWAWFRPALGPRNLLGVQNVLADWLGESNS